MRFTTELFAHFVYSQELSYEELLIAEEQLQVAVTEILTTHKAQFVNFEAFGDTLQVQCSFSCYAETFFHEIADAVSDVINKNVEARLLFVDKFLDAMALYCIANGKWHEAVLHIPTAGPIGAELRKLASIK